MVYRNVYETELGSLIDLLKDYEVKKIKFEEQIESSVSKLSISSDFEGQKEVQVINGFIDMSLIVQIQIEKILSILN